ncbi:MAG TPA: hypothetical protein VIO61_15450 [Anaerolineaceae bacterium]
MNVVYVYADSKLEWNCAEWRCVIPAKGLQRSGRHSAQLLDLPSFTVNTPEAQDICSKADVIVVQRNLFGAVLSAIQRWKARDKVVITDFDDAYNLIPPTVKNYEFWIEGKLPPGPGNEGKNQRMTPPPLTQFKWGLRLVHGATMPSRRLADDWKAYTDTYYLPNYFDLDRYLNISPIPHDRVILGWGGSLSHLQSFKESGLLPALMRVCDLRPDIRVMICGDPRVFEAIPLPREQKIFQAWVPAQEWPRVLANFDIGLAPLAGSYDERRSWIKVMEYMVMKIPFAASDNVAYQELRPYGRLVKNTADEWETTLLEMIDQIDGYRADAAGEPYLFALSQGIDENVDKMINIYETIRAKVYGNSAGSGNG